MDTIKIPDGWERVEFNKDTVIHPEWKVWDSYTFVPTASSGCKMLFEFLIYIRPIPAPVAPEGHEIVTDKSIPKADGWLYWNPVENKWCKPLFTDQPQTKDDTYARPIVPASPTVKCPACGRPMTALGDGIYCRCEWSGCELLDRILPISLVKRICVEPEPLVCPVCGCGVGVVSRTVGVAPTAFFAQCLSNNCRQSGPLRPTEQEAVEAFRKLRYEK